MAGLGDGSGEVLKGTRNTFFSIISIIFCFLHCLLLGRNVNGILNNKIPAQKVSITTTFLNHTCKDLGV